MSLDPKRHCDPFSRFAQLTLVLNIQTTLYKTYVGNGRIWVLCADNAAY